MDRVSVKIADSSLPACPVEGGSWTAASAGAAVAAACRAVAETLLKHARRRDQSPLANASLEHVVLADGRIALKSDPAQGVSFADAMASAGVDTIAAEERASRSKLTEEGYSCYTHSAVFAEVRVDEQLGVVRVVRVVNAVAGGRIINPKTARSQILGGVVMGIGMALHEETLPDHNLGRFMTHNFADYHIPANADVRDIDVIFVDEHDDKVSPLGVKGLGEIGLVGVAAAIGNAVHHATGKRIRELPITLDKLL
jgi:xanthine dehydrogenase YagR molybdenum-binding subunit